MTCKERIYATIQGRPHDRPPVTPLFMSWTAQFIGRTYRDYCLDGEVTAAAQIAVARALGTDHVSCISDPWTEADSYGMKLDYPDWGVGIPREMFLSDPVDLSKLRRLDPHQEERMKQRIRSVQIMAREVDKTHCVCGWVEGAAAEYADLRGVQEAMLDFIDAPETFHQAAEIIVANAIEFAKAQIEVGADMIGVGDAVASLVGPQIYVEHVLPWEKKLIAGIKAAGATVKLHICGNIGAIVGKMAETGADVIDVDWMVSLSHAREKAGPRVTLAGNFDPSAVLLRGTPQQVAAAARQCIEQGGERFILQPGCEVPPGTPLENLRAFCPSP